MRTARVKRSVMLLKTLIGVAIFAGTTVAAVGQEEQQPTRRQSQLWRMCSTSLK